MKNHLALLITSFFLLSFVPGTWIVEKQEKFTLFFDSSDIMERNLYIKFFEQGIEKVEKFTGKPYHRRFAVYVHSSRTSFDEQWQRDWKMPEFISECWMVASGVGDKLDIIAPSQWKEQSCEHELSDTVATQKLITHELMHVYHGQVNRDSVFDSLDNLDWLVEGLAVFASGQCDKKRIAEVKALIKMKQSPTLLADFWKGKDKYGLSGSMVMYVDNHYGRKKLLSLLQMNSSTEVLTALKTNEKALITEWGKYVSGL